MPIRRVLLVDDDAALAAVLKDALGEEGFQVAVAANGLEGWRQFEAAPPDLVILDILMPELDGLEVCRRIRKGGSRVPVILLSSRGEEVDRITGLDTGADDYVTKPFSTRELCARIRALDRRVHGGAEPLEGEVLRAGALEIDPPRFAVRWKGQPCALTRSEFLLLLALAKNPGFVLSRDRLLDLARGDDVVVTERTVDTFIKRIRKKLRAAEESFDEIETVVGVGYRYRKAPGA